MKNVTQRIMRRGAVIKARENMVSMSVQLMGSVRCSGRQAMHVQELEDEDNTQLRFKGLIAL